MASLDVPPSYPPPPPPKRPVRPKITLQIPDAPAPMTPRTASVYYGSPRFPKAPGTPGSHMSDHHLQFNPFGHMYHSKASEFMFKQFEGFKDFTVNAAKSGLSVGEKTAFWLYNKFRVLSKRWFTHLFLTFSLVLYSVIGAAIFATLEKGNEDKYDRNLTDIRRGLADKIRDIVITKELPLEDNSLDLLTYIQDELMAYESNYTECIKHLNDNNLEKKTWTFWNSMFYAGTIYTTIEEITSQISGKHFDIGGRWKMNIVSEHSFKHVKHPVTPQFNLEASASQKKELDNQGMTKWRKAKVRLHLDAEPTLNHHKAVELVLALEVTEWHAGTADAVGTGRGAPGSPDSTRLRLCGDKVSWMMAAAAETAGCAPGRCPASTRGEILVHTPNETRLGGDRVPWITAAAAEAAGGRGRGRQRPRAAHQGTVPLADVVRCLSTRRMV